MTHGEYGARVTGEDRNDEIGELARAFNTMSAELAETDRQRRDIVANVAHELRTPIGALQAKLENVADGVEQPDAETLETMLGQVRRLGRLVEQLLDLSRLESQATPFDARPFGVAPVLEDVAREVRLHAPDGVSLDVTTSDGEPRVFGDAERMHQVVLNLVENAVRHSPQPGRVALTASRPGGNGRVRIEVTDQGPGIPPDEAERVFERFYRTDRARSADAGGTGLGLAIARWIVDGHGGDDPRRGGRADRLPDGRRATRRADDATPSLRPGSGQRRDRSAPPPSTPRFAARGARRGLRRRAHARGREARPGRRAGGDRAGGRGAVRLAAPSRRLGLRVGRRSRSRWRRSRSCATRTGS